MFHIRMESELNMSLQWIMWESEMVAHTFEMLFDWKLEAEGPVPMLMLLV